MLRSIWSKTFRDYRIPILAWGLGLGILPLITYATFAQQQIDPEVGSTFQELGEQFSFLGEPIAVDTIDGFTTWRSMAFMVPLLASLWAILAASRLIRGKEDQGIMDILLSTPQARVRLLLEKLGALTSALLIIGLFIGLGSIAGQAIGEAEIRVEHALLNGLNVSLFALFFATVTLFLSQIIGSRGAVTSWASGFMVLCFFLDGTGRVTDNLWMQYFSPLYYYNLNKPLIATFENNIWGAVILLGGCILLTGISIPLFKKRDIGGTAFTFSGIDRTTNNNKQPRILLQRAWKDISCYTVINRALYVQALPALLWMLTIVIISAWITTLIPSLLEPLQKIVQGNPALEALFSGEDIATNANFIGSVVFLLIPIFTVSFILTQALNWSKDLDSGQLELILSTPASRIQVFLERFAAVLVIIIIVPFGIWGAILLGAQIADIAVDAKKVGIASLSILPLELLMATFVYALAPRIRTPLLTGIATVYLAAAFLVEMLGSVLNLPEGAYNLSIFYAYGTPIQDGWQWESISIMLGIALLFLLIGIFQFSRVDIDRG